MNRYNFRGFDAIGKKGWVYGDLVHNQKVSETGLEARVMVGGYEVFPDSVGLYTGLSDGCGKPIFEGDVLLESRGKFGGVVMWHSNGYFYINDTEELIELSTFTPLGEMLRYTDFVIVGSVFEKSKSGRNDKDK